MRAAVDTLLLRRWLSTATAPTAVLVACHEHQMLDAWRAPRLGSRQIIYRLDGCLAELLPAALLEILAGGAVSVAGLLDGCANPSAAHAVLTRAGRIAAAVAPDGPVHALTDPPLADARQPGGPDGRRRLRHRSAPVELLEVLDARAMPVSRRALAGLGGALGQLETHPGLRLYAVVRELLGAAPVPSGLADIATGAAQLEAAQCCGSGVCVRTCPTRALTLMVTDLIDGAAASAQDGAGPTRAPQVVGGAAFSDAGLQQFVLTVDPAACIDCGQCVEVCPESAMSRVGSLPWAQALRGLPTTLRVWMVRRCSRCGVAIRTPEPLCAVCAFRTVEPFGSQLPPGFTRQARA
jgi:ferredoxin